MADKKVTEKSTKGEIWDAYSDALRDLQTRPVSVSEDPIKLQKMATALTEAKAALMGHFESTIERLSTVQQAYSDADHELATRKTSTIDSLEVAKQNLEREMATVTRQWSQEKADEELTRQREAESYQYELARRRRDEEASYAQKRRDQESAYEQKMQAREATLAEREKTVSERESQVDSLQKQVADFPATQELAVKAATEAITKDLKQQALTDLKETRQNLEHDKSILALKLQSAENGAATLTKQIVDLQRQLDASNLQLRDMAVAVIQAKQPDTATSQPTTV